MAHTDLVNVYPDSLPAFARLWLLPMEFNHLSIHNSARHPSSALPYTRWVAAVRCAMPLTPPCLEGPVETLPTRLVEAFDSACASSTPSHPKRYLKEKRDSLHGLGLQIRNLGLWAEGEGPVSRLHSGIEPLVWSNIESAEFASLRLRHALEAIDCVFMVSGIFFSIGHVPEPYIPAHCPLSWVPYTVPPRNFDSTADRTAVPELAHRAMRFREYKNSFKFSASVSDPNATGAALTTYWSNCAGLPGKAIVSNLSALVLKLVRCCQLAEKQV